MAAVVRVRVGLSVVMVVVGMVVMMVMVADRAGVYVRTIAAGVLVYCNRRARQEQRRREQKQESNLPDAIRTAQYSPDTSMSGHGHCVSTGIHDVT